VWSDIFVAKKICMKRIFVWALGTLVVLLGAAIIGVQRREIGRLRENTATLAEQLQKSTPTPTTEHLSVGRTRWSVGELGEFRPDYTERIKSLGIKLRRTQSLSVAASLTRLDTTLLAIPASMADDSTGHAPLAPQATSHYQWSDGWVNIEATTLGDSLRWSLTSCDTLYQVVHRVPHRWWIFRWGTKAIRQEIRSSNPHTRLTYAEYIRIEN
jgi:hypothetical protein